MSAATFAELDEERPTVSVIMANYNGAAHLRDSIRSVCRQSLRNIEIIVSDDASTDESVSVIKELLIEDTRIKLVVGELNRGPAAARNMALRIATGEWIAVMDSDDLMHPARLKTLVEAANRDGADIVADDLLIFDSDHTKSARTLLTGKWARTPLWIDILTYVRLNKLYGRGPTLGYLKPVIRSHLLARFPDPYDEDLRIAEDYNLIFRLLGAGARYRVYPVLFYFYRKHASSISHRVSENVLVRLKTADLGLLQGTPSADRALSASIRKRIRSIEIGLAFESVLDSLKVGAYFRAIATICENPRTVPLLRFPIGARLGRLLPKREVQATTIRRQVCVISRQRIVGRTNGSSVYLIDLAAALAARGFEPHFLSPSPATLGRWPYLILSDDLSVFKTFRIRGTWRWGNYLVTQDPRRMIQGLLAMIEQILVNAGFLSKPFFRRAPYSIAEPLGRKDQLFLARYAPLQGDFLIADYCFLTDALPYALRPDARSAVLMHDLFSSRINQFNAAGLADSVVTLTEDEEFARLAKADYIVAVQSDEAAIVRRHLPDHRVLLVPIAACPRANAQAGDSDLVLFVGSSAAPNVYGLRWFLESCWPLIRTRRPKVHFWVAGSVSQVFGPPPEGVSYLGLVDDLAPLYRQAGVVISPLRVGSGLKIKLIEALQHGKAVVATSTTLQGVSNLLSDAVLIANDPEEFATAIVTLLDDETLRANLATRGLDALMRHFSPEKSYGAFLEEIANSSALVSTPTC